MSDYIFFILLIKLRVSIVTLTFVLTISVCFLYMLQTRLIVIGINMLTWLTLLTWQMGTALQKSTRFTLNTVNKLTDGLIFDFLFLIVRCTSYMKLVWKETIHWHYTYSAENTVHNRKTTMSSKELQYYCIEIITLAILKTALWGQRCAFIGC